MINVLNVRSMDQTLAASLAEPRAVVLLLTAFAAVALLLGSLGLYGVMGNLVRERRREIGIRLALGASLPSILRGVVRAGLLLTTGGLALGGVLSVGLTRLLESQLHGVSPRDPVIFTAVGTLLLVTGLLASYLPARRAGRTDPADVLRSD